ncbi:MAG: hypothetical protein D6802_12880, partial [Ardenticatenia bacterium]
MNTRELLQKRLETLRTLTQGGLLRRGTGNQHADLQHSLQAQWATEARLIRRVLAADGDLVETLIEWRTRTEQFHDRYPERDGWTDRQGETWNVVLVLQAIDNLLE